MEQLEDFRLELAIGRTPKKQGPRSTYPQVSAAPPKLAWVGGGVAFLDFSEGNSEKSYLGGVEIFFPAWAIIYTCWRTTDWELFSFSQVFPLSVVSRGIHCRAPDNVWNRSCSPSVGTCEHIEQSRASQPGGKFGRRACYSLKGWNAGRFEFGPFNQG
jgi:hypothetical protein